MDGRTRRLYSSTTRKPAFQLRPQPRFVVTPVAPAPAVNAIRPFVRALPTPLSAVKATPTLALPKLGVAGLAFGLGFFIGDALINPLLGQRSVFDWGLWNSPDGTPDYLRQDPLPDDLSVISTGEMGTEGAKVSASATYLLAESDGDSGCKQPVEGSKAAGSPDTVDAGGGQLRYVKGVPFTNNCGVDYMQVQVLLRPPGPGEEPAWRSLRTINFSNASPRRGTTQADFDVVFEPLGDPLPSLPLPAWEPQTVPKPQIEPEPQVEPQTEPQRRPLAPPLIPQAPPDAVPVPSPTPAPTIQPAPSPSTPKVPTPTKLVPLTTPSLTPVPGYTTNIFPWQNTPEDAPKNKIVPTDKSAHFIRNAFYTGGTARHSLNYISREVTRIEQKTAAVNRDWDKIGLILQFLETLLEALNGGLQSETKYTLQGVCEDVPEGEEQPITEFVVEGGLMQYAQLNRLDAIAKMLQTHLELRTPTCRPERKPLQGDWRTISFISDETSPYGKSRLRKRLRYRSLSGLGLGEVIDHWADFTWTAGPVCVIHSGASWGTPQVWASSVDEGKRVIRHAAGESGLDPDQVGKWTVSGSSSSRVGVSGTMRVNQTGGFYWITARDGTEGRPIVGRV